MRFVLYCICLVFLLKIIFALSLSDFVPSFIYGRNESFNGEVKPIVNVKRNSSGENIWYCIRNLKNITNVFCNKSNQSNAVTFNNSSGDKSPVIDSSANNNNGQQLNNVPATLQDQNVKDALKNQNLIFLPLTPEENLKMDINQQRVQFHYKY
ncbi:MAG: hypothetical protein ORN24_04290 [Burkholderiales bacterium]|nr:hypothetical protein [Burkholderiales bacterium]